ncbi:MAG: hypothetical protein ACTSQA_00145 [Candidatus Heimdallarchaeaceae archaeon]
MAISPSIHQREQDKFGGTDKDTTFVKTGLTDSSGSPISGSNPLPVQLDGDFAINVQVDSSDSKIEYIGTAVIGSLTSAAVWKIKRVNYTTGTIIEYAGGSESFTNIFSQRESLSYS